MGFDTALKRYFAGLVLALIAIAAYFQASGITQLVGAALAPDPKALAAANAAGARAPAPPVSGAPDDHATSAPCVFDRNPFDSLTPPPLDSPPVVDAGVAAVFDLEHYENAPPCEGVKA